MLLVFRKPGPNCCRLPEPGVFCQFEATMAGLLENMMETCPWGLEFDNCDLHIQ